MARPTTIDDEVILEAARQAFLEEGYAATTASIARRAGVSPGSLFKRFTSKEELFWRAMHDSEADERGWSGQLATRIGRFSMKENLAYIVVSLLLQLRRDMPRIMMAWSNLPPEFISSRFAVQGHPADIVARNLQAYLAAEMELGRLRPFDVSEFSRVLMGYAFHSVFMQMAHDTTRSVGAETPEIHAQANAQAERFLAVFWQGLAPAQD
jgi:AcrR family transcriptional regulator